MEVLSGGEMNRRLAEARDQARLQMLGAVVEELAFLDRLIELKSKDIETYATLVAMVSNLGVDFGKLRIGDRAVMDNGRYLTYPPDDIIEDGKGVVVATREIIDAKTGKVLRKTSMKKD